MAARAKLEDEIADLARRFPSVAGVACVRRWDAVALDRWASEVAVSHGELVTARFLLAVWNPDHPWRCGRFDVMEALGVWDAAHTAAFVEWVKNPWWC